MPVMIRKGVWWVVLQCPCLLCLAILWCILLLSLEWRETVCMLFWCLFCCKVGVFGLFLRMLLMRWMSLRRLEPYSTDGRRSLLTRWLIESPMFFLLLGLCEMRFFGMNFPSSLIVCWCCSPMGYTSACLSCLMQSGVRTIPWPRSTTSDRIALSTCSRASCCSADLWFPPSSRSFNSLISHG